MAVGQTEATILPLSRVMASGCSMMMTLLRYKSHQRAQISSAAVLPQEIEPHEIENYFGLTDAQQLQRTGASESGYILFYQCRNLT